MITNENPQQNKPKLTDDLDKFITDDFIDSLIANATNKDECECHYSPTLNEILGYPLTLNEIYPNDQIVNNQLNMNIE